MYPENFKPVSIIIFEVTDKLKKMSKYFEHVEIIKF